MLASSDPVLKLNAAATRLQLLTHRHAVLELTPLSAHALGLHAVCSKLLAVLRLLHPVGSELLSVPRLHAIGPKLLPVLGLHVLGPQLMAILRRDPVGVDLPAARHPSLHPLLALGMHLSTIAVLRPFEREALSALHALAREALSALHGHSRRALRPLHGEVLGPLRRRKSAAAAAAVALSAATTAAHHERRLASASAMWSASAAAMIAVRACTCRGCDRQRGYARCEKHPGHHKISFRTAKRMVRSTVPTLKRMELAL
ncbi:MAG TPA: hypothetical protein VFW39_06510 [Sphingomicrobium sp.]|nr:hypothetical protein [Sphingomicrobium sp.]